MLDAVAQLAEDVFGDVIRVLGDEIHAHPFGADQARHLFHLVDQRLGCVVKQQVCFVEEEDQLGFVRITHLGQFLEQFGRETTAGMWRKAGAIP